MLPEALNEEIRKVVARTVTPRYQDAARDVQQAKRDNATRIARVNEPPAQLPLAAEDRAEFRSLDVGGRSKWIARADRSQLAALIVAGRARFPGTPDELFNEIIERHAVLAHVEKTGLQADFSLQPTPDHPAAVGPDVAAAEAATREAMLEWRAEQRAIDDAESALRAVIVAIALATELSVGDAFQLLNGEAA